MLVTAGGSYYGTGARHPDPGLAVAGVFAASLLGDDLDARRSELGRTLPIRRVVEPEDVAALAVHIMTNSALTGATFDVDGGEQVLGKE